MDSSNEQSVVEVSADGVKLHGVYEDFRPAVQTAVATVNHILRVVENIAGVPADFVSFHLGHFRDRYRARIETMPAENRELPPLRIGCLVLNQVAYAADEPKFQEMFADLLAAASDNSVRDRVHPGFATIINQLSSLDCQLLLELRTNAVLTEYPPIAKEIFGNNVDAAKTSIANLVRLGLGDWQYPDAKVNPFLDSNSFVRAFESSAGPSRHNPNVLMHVDQVKRGLEGASKELYNKLKNEIEQSNYPIAVKLSRFGEEFIAACLPENRTTVTGR